MLDQVVVVAEERVDCPLVHASALIPVHQDLDHNYLWFHPRARYSAKPSIKEAMIKEPNIFQLLIFVFYPYPIWL